MSFEELEKLVIDWGEEKGILKNATPLQQWQKIKEEVEELGFALFAKQNAISNFVDVKSRLKGTDEEIKDAVGDVLVTVILTAKLAGVSPVEALESAYNIIRKRTGKMINGKFVKDE